MLGLQNILHSIGSEIDGVIETATLDASDTYKALSPVLSVDQPHKWFAEHKVNIGLFISRAVYCIKSIGIIKLIPVSVSERQINNTFNITFHIDINKHKAIY